MPVNLVTSHSNPEVVGTWAWPAFAVLARESGTCPQLPPPVRLTSASAVAGCKERGAGLRSVR